jgi:hypothetical protein
MKLILLSFLLSLSVLITGQECNDFKHTINSYTETDNLNSKIISEFGSSYSIADWNDLKAISDINAWISCMGLTNNEAFMVTKNSSYFYNNGNRQYFVQYFSNGSAPGSFLVHDKIGNYLYLGSWYGLNNTILAKNGGTTDIKQLSNINTIIYPNPLNQTLTIKTDLNEFYAEIYSSSGQIVLSFENKHKIDLTGFENGLYILKLTSKDYIETIKIVKE